VPAPLKPSADSYATNSKLAGGNQRVSEGMGGWHGMPAGVLIAGGVHGAIIATSAVPAYGRLAQGDEHG
jgi:hypothetical protein